MKPTPSRAPDPVVAAILARLQAHEGRLARLERARGPRDQADEQLLLALDRATAGLPFRASAILLRAEDVPELAEALRAADIDNEKQLGKLCARLEGRLIGTLLLARRMIRGRRHWQIWVM